MSERTFPIKITHGAAGEPSVLLAGVELSGVLATDGVTIRYVDGFEPMLCGVRFPVPEVTLKFAPGALELDFEVDLLRQMLSDAEARA